MTEIQSVEPDCAPGHYHQWRSLGGGTPTHREETCIHCDRTRLVPRPRPRPPIDVVRQLQSQLDIAKTGLEEIARNAPRQSQSRRVADQTLKDIQKENV
jgi:hypothetical protein